MNNVLEDPIELQTMVDDALRRAEDNGYDFKGRSVTQIAEDICTYDQDFELIDPRFIEGFVRCFVGRRVG